MFFNKTRKEFGTLLQLGSYRVLWGRCKSGKTMYRIYQCMCMMRSIWGLGASLRERI